MHYHSRFFDIHADLPLLRPRLGLGLSLIGAVIFAGLVSAKNPPALKLWLACQGIAISAIGLKYSSDLKGMDNHLIIQKEARLNLVSEQAAVQATIFNNQPANNSAPGDGDSDRLPTEINWGDILSAPHLAVVGKTGSGKSALTQWLASQFGGDIAVYDSDASPSEWNGLRVIGRGADYGAIAYAMEQDLIDMQHRTEARANGRQDFPPMIRILEESPETLSALKDNGHEIGYQWLKGILRRGRKYGVKLILLSQGFSVRSLRIEGEGELRDNIAVLRLGKVALQYAKDETIKQALKAQPRPLLIEDELVGCVPDLSGFLAAQKSVISGDHPSIPLHKADTGTQPDTDRTQWLNHLYTLDFYPSDTQTQDTIAPPEPPQTCPHCGSTDTKGNGVSPTGKPRRRCKSCGKSWSE